jgi:hypothetical protein
MLDLVIDKQPEAGMARAADSEDVLFKKSRRDNE